MGQQLNDLPNNQTHLVFNYNLTEGQCGTLAGYIEFNADSLPFTELTLRINPNIFKFEGESLIFLMKVLNKVSIKQLRLIIPENTGHLIVDKLPAPINYPITFSESSPAYQTFASQVIPNIQQHNIKKLHARKNSLPVVAFASEEHLEIDQVVIDPKAKKIKLKELIQRADVRDHTYDHHIKAGVATY